jgi:acyl carrier protein
MAAIETEESHSRSLIRSFILDRLARAKGVTSFSDEESLTEKGVIDSLGTFQLVEFLERTFGIRISDDEITGENFDSIAAIETLVNEKIKP